MRSLKTLLQSTAHLFYPHVCVGCSSDLLASDALLCLQCLTDLPYTAFEKYPHNPIERIFIGRLPIVAATSGFYFSKGELMQTLIHEFKYRGNKDIGMYLSKLMAEKMMLSNRFKNVDFLIPLPLFAAKEFKRGFNQATIISLAMSEVMNVPVVANNVARIAFTETQTKKNRSERWDNVSESFKVLNPAILEAKHILLVDDVITTGATLEACAQKIKQLAGTQISIATLATASK